MKKIILHKIGLIMFMVLLNFPLALHGAELEITVKNIRNSQGKIVLSIWNETDAFWKRKEALKTVGKIPISNGGATATVMLNVGKYAITVYHDEDGNDKFKFNQYRQPMEGWGISRNSRGYPTFDEAAIAVEDRSNRIEITMLYARKVSFVIEGIRNRKGKLMMGIYNRPKTFLKPNGAIAGSKNITITGNRTTFDFMLLPGTYAATVIHDENSNDDLDTNFVGIPKEGYGFSRNASGGFGPPDFKDAAFFLDPEREVLQKIRLKY